MKRIIRLISYTIILAFISLSFASGQEGKSEHKIKVLIADGSGTNVVLDTLIRGQILNDSVTLRNGKVIFIGTDSDFDISNDGDKEKNVFVTVSANGKSNDEMVKNITVITSDSLKWTARADNNSENVIVWSGNSDADSDGKVIVINDKVISKSNSGSYSYSVNTNKKDMDSETTKYVISKDGMRITIEGDDYNKVKELSKQIQENFNSSSNKKEKKTEVKR